MIGWRARAADRRIALAPPMLFEDFGTALRVGPRPPGDRFHQGVDPAGTRHAKQAEAEQAAQPFDPRIGFAAAAARRSANGEPNLVANGRTVHGLENEFEREAQFQFADHQRDRRAAIDGDDIAAAHLALDLEAQPFEKALHRRIKARLQRPPSTRRANRRAYRDNTGASAGASGKSVRWRGKTIPHRPVAPTPRRWARCLPIRRLRSPRRGRRDCFRANPSPAPRRHGSSARRRGRTAPCSRRF